MNAPLAPHILRALQEVRLDDKYRLERGRAFMSGVQALVRLPLMQQARDAAQGVNTAGFISGYRGSPLGGYDQALWSAKTHLAAQHIVFQPGVNEELAATAVWGTQQLDLFPEKKKFDGVFGIWYGKGPGVDRCSDVFKHANMAGTSRYGGVLALAGDDHVAKSSTAAHQSDHIFKACGLPVFFPSDVQGILDMGLHALAMSRFAGLWASMKTIQDVVESSASIEVDNDRVQIVLPHDFPMPADGVHLRWPDAPLDQEARLMETKWYAALAYVRANRLNHNVIAGPHDRFGVIASGKAFQDTLQALNDLGLTREVCQRIGLRLHKVNVVWPLEPTITRDFAQGLQEILVVEEKRQIIEYQLKEELYNWRADVRPDVVGKFNEPEGDHSGGEWSQPNPTNNVLLRSKADLSPALIAKALAKRLFRLGVPDDVAAGMRVWLAVLQAKEEALRESQALTGTANRPPWFCSGCPHNTSTRVPEGSRALAGIGCHYMVLWMDRSTTTFTQMGGEGVPWVGQSPFISENHVFANIGDGTWFHSGSLAIRQAVAAGVNITYKILYNDAVAMTGGQQVGERPEGLSVPQIVKSCIAEGVSEVAVVTDEPKKYAGVVLEAGVSVLHRDALDGLQKRFREVPGTTVIVYDQTCATEKRRRRKRGRLADPDRFVVINDLVCEGCGDCSSQSNCLSVEPKETPFGRKRTINLNSCNKDESCLKGFCPSFVTVEGATRKKPGAKAEGSVDPAPELDTLPAPPEPMRPSTAQAYGMVAAGIGGTGVITIGQILGMAAHLEGKAVVTQDSAGLAQKGGSTWSHIQVASSAAAIAATKIDMAKADLILACDGIVAAGATTLAMMQTGRTRIALNAHQTPTAEFVSRPDWQFPAQACQSSLARAAGGDHVAGFDAQAMSVALLGDAIYANPMLLGFAWQKGWVPLLRETILQAMALNGVQVERNQQAFAWGRQLAHDPEAVRGLLSGPAAQPRLSEQPMHFAAPETLASMISRRVAFLTDYQNAAYAARYQSLVRRVAEAEKQATDTERLAQAVARYFFKLMAYKDEYEVARLHTQPEFLAELKGQFEGDFRIVHHLAPPLFSQRNDKGELVKSRYGPWVRVALRLLAPLKVLRGSVLDVFGYTDERRTERALITRYETALLKALPQLRPDTLESFVQWARIPEKIRGYGHVKHRHLQAVSTEWQTLEDAMTAGATRSGRNGPHSSP
jgi:indolepyruvate ferredoxin oxidoreductase